MKTMRESICERRPQSCCLKSEMEVVESTGIAKVGGSPSPEKDVKRTLIVLNTIVQK